MFSGYHVISGCRCESEIPVLNWMTYLVGGGGGEGGKEIQVCLKIVPY